MSDHEHDDTLPDEVWEQDVANGGAVDGHLPPAAAAVVVQGVTLVREAPPLRHNSGSVTLVAAGAPFGLGREPRRRRLLVSVVSATPGAYVIAGDDPTQVLGGYGLAIPAGQLVTLHTADRLYFDAVGGDVLLSWMSELDQG